MEWPTQSPDLNSIENMWHGIKLQKQAQKITTNDQLSNTEHMDKYILLIHKKTL